MMRILLFPSSLRGLVEGEQEISLVLGQPQQGLMQCHILCYLQESKSGCLSESLEPLAPFQVIPHSLALTC
jgi:hypothetical protein